MFKYRVINNTFYNFYKNKNFDSYIYGYAKNSGFLEPKLYRKLKLILRKINRSYRGTTPLKKKIFNRYFIKLKRFCKIWFFLRPNYIFSKKSKNARMGKGKGKFKRWLIRVKRGDLIFKMHGSSFNKLYYKFLLKYNKNFKIRINISNSMHRVLNNHIIRKSPWIIFDAFRFS